MAVVLLACRAVDPGPRGAGPVAVAPEEPTREVESEVAQDDPAAQGEGVPIHVLSVTDEMEPVQFGLAPPGYHQAAEQHAAFVAESRENHTRIAVEAAERLGAAGRQADSTMRSGGAADEILDFASEAGADLVVVGSHGRTGLARIFLGSVARNVLYGSRASVLVVRAQPAT